MHHRSLVRIRIALVFILIAAAGFLVIQRQASPINQAERDVPALEKASKAARWEYMFNMVRDPSTDAIPKAIRSREMQHARALRSNLAASEKTRRATLTWDEVGPSDVGGRTRAFAIDRNDPNRLLAGGVSGGLWESTNSGLSWSPLSLDGGNLSVSYIKQDPRPGNTNTWYYASGEFIGNSASDPARLAPYFGSGVYKSTDNGVTWALLPAASPIDINDLDTPFDYVNRIDVSPVTGTLFLATNLAGIYRSSDGGQTLWTELDERNFPAPALGGINDHTWSDVAVNDEGIVLATLSTGSNTGPQNTPGIYVSTDDGVSWRDITPSSFPIAHGRSIVAFVPSNPDIAYVFTTTLQTIGNNDNAREDVRLHRINVRTGASANLSSNLAAISEAGDISTQFGYNMALAVSPSDENLVILGGTNVYRSRDGFSSFNSNRLDYWIGGYDAVDDDFGSYANHHPDQHLFVFDPSIPNRLWTANDGGIYNTNDITVAEEVTWNDRNQGYNVTQFYTVALSAQGLDPRITGGAQDNGTPFLSLEDQGNSSRNIGVGDGARVFLADAFAYVGFQNGATLRLQYNLDGVPTFGGFSFIQPSSATDQLFVTPFAVDPNDEDVMYYPAGGTMWRNNQLTRLPSGQTDNEGSDRGWTELNNLPFPGTRVITAVSVSRQPAHILYYAASDTRRDNAAAPRVYRLEDANTATGRNVEVTSLPSGIGNQDINGAYVADIAINPSDADEILVVVSNYNKESLFHSTDGGANYTRVQGNLAGNQTFPGPSVRAATILPTDGETRYYVGTSTGLYSTASLDGSATNWEPEGDDTIGQAVVWDITSRTSDDVVAVATHGRGLFLGSDGDFIPGTNTDDFLLAQNYPNPFATTTVITYDIPSASRISLSVYDLSGRHVATILSNREQETGRYEVEFNAASLASGVYLYRLQATPVGSESEFGTYSETMKMMILK